MILDFINRIKMINFIHASEAKNYTQQAELNVGLYQERLAKMIEENAKQGNTAVFTVLPKHLPLQEIRHLSAELSRLGYHVRFEVDEFYYSFNVHWN